MSEYLSDYWKQLNSLIGESNLILLSTHVNSDADGLGSEIAMYYYLKSLGKECKIINPSSFSEVYRIINPEDIVACYSKDQDKWIKEYEAHLLTIAYVENRKNDYPAIEDQLDKIYHDGIDAWKADMIKPIKDKHPKE